MINPRTPALPTTVRELAGYLTDEYPTFAVAYVRDREQPLKVAPSGTPEPPAALRELLASTDFAMQGLQVTDRRQWVTIANATTAIDVGEVGQP